MAYLKKRRNTWYVRYHIVEYGKELTITRTLKTKRKDVAEKRLEKLEKLEKNGRIHPLSDNFNPIEILNRLEEEEQNTKCNTVQESLEAFLKSKKHLSSKTVEAYEWAIQHFIDHNGIAFHHPIEMRIDHFENIIFKDDISIQTRHYYFRHFRAWWNWMLDNNIVDFDFFDAIKKKMPKKKESTRPKMITLEELYQVFKAYGEELVRKSKRPDFDAKKVQYWFRPIMCLYTFAGLRKHEAGYSSDLPYSGLKGENLIFKNKELEYIYIPPGKGRKEKEIPIHPILKKELDRYLKVRGEVDQDEYVFIYFGGRFKGRPVSGQVVYKEFKRYAELADVPSSRTLHGMRHRAVTSWIELGLSTADAAFLAGHSNQRVTEKYTHLTAKHLKDKMNRLTNKKDSD
ncbi:tyrosine-type recombinase/integrase [Rhodohalobacter sulfatireducens]|uniref:Site-specific integrase n=1 Tax=Rhodohalobacter sulfatireducens TaxID=2911366 RepID=A0ABS9KA83_9BACT|nr:tyrosine-type recombinase/integrase [Rhodohalobacter sulfatireducens]MCG2587759.1 site-specific integrase [Rhodohalobacter sulfatireducens]